MTDTDATRFPDPEMLSALRAAGLLETDEQATFEELAGGVSSDIWKIGARRGTYCVKRALSRLRVAAVWEAPLERNRYEVAWYQVVHEVLPDAVPEILHFDAQSMLFAMQYLDPQTHKLWKSSLRDGDASVDVAAEVGRRLGLIHAATAGNDRLDDVFPANDIFHAIRLEPYLEATAARHPDLRETLFALSERTRAIRKAMVHGDVSPKNILVGPHGPVFLDAECACIGDPAFDVAFVLNHLLLKCLWNPGATNGFLESFAALSNAYLAQVTWEPRAALEARAASLLPGLLLARVDGKSPVEYIDREVQREQVRRCARALLIDTPLTLAAVASAWRKELAT